MFQPEGFYAIPVRGQKIDQEGISFGVHKGQGMPAVRIDDIFVAVYRFVVGVI